MKKKKSKRKLLTILKYSNSILRVENLVVENPSKHLEFVQNMIYTMKSLRGVGLAAPQVGENIRLAVALIDKKPLVIFNPEIIDGSPGGEPFEEGCLSLPGINATVGRPRWINVKYLDIKGCEHIRRFEDFNCVIICHEIDHLNGLLITDCEKET